MEIEWKYKKFDALNAEELYAILHLRNLVFVVEQNCVYNDTDGKDKNSFHLCGYIQNELACYTRIIPPNVSYKECSIGRVVTNPAYRRNGLGNLLMNTSIEHCKSQFWPADIKIGAQLYLKKFYTNLGFVQCSEIYLEDGIPHIEMILSH